MRRSIAVAGAALLCAAQTAGAEKHCIFEGTAYRPGVVVCQHGTQHRCQNGSWTDLRADCPQTVAALSPAQAAALVAVTDVQMHDGWISGHLVNRSPNPVRNVELLVRHAWRWNDEHHPGEHDPGRASFFTVEGEIAPRASVPFQYRESRPLPTRSDGHFHTSVQVIRFAEVGG